MANTLIKVGRYQIAAELGRGSMGVVYRGFDPVIGRTIAIKTMLTEGLPPAEFQEYKARFQREAQTAGVLAHPNIVTVYDFGEDAGVLYLAMEFLEGKSLQHMIDEQKILPIETIIPMFTQVCSALDHAHTHKIVHRDVKPANIMILDNGLVKVADFGIAKMMSMGMTQAGQILGTPNYMSPEQVKGRSVDGRSDIFSLGVILYELVTGEKPFGGQNITTVIYKIINEDPIPPRELDATIHPGLSFVISKALTKNPDERYQTCRELGDDLKNYKNVEGVVSPDATVIVKVPPLQRTVPPATHPAASTRQAAGAVAPDAKPRLSPAAAPGEHELRRPWLVQAIPQARHQSRTTSPLTWILAVVLLLAASGGGYYFFLLHRQAAPTRQTVPQSNQPVPAPVAAPPASDANSQPGAPPEGIPSGSSSTPEMTPTAATTGTFPATPAASEKTIAGYAGQEQAKPEPATEVPSSESAPTVPKKSKLVAPKMGELVVTANVRGARILIDGRSESDWVTPHKFSQLPAGTHLVVISKDGYDDAEQNVTIEGGRASSVNAQLTAPTGEINIITTPAGVEVFIDGRSYGPSPVRATVTAGPHKYTIKGPGMKPYENQFVMKDGAIMTRSIDLGGGVGVATGIVDARTIPPGATVYADEAPIGGQTPTSFRLPAGHHVLRFSMSGYQVAVREVDVPASGSVPVNVTLPPSPP